MLPPGEILNASTDSHKSRHKSTPALVKSFVTKQTKNVTIGAGCDHGGLVTFPWRLVTFPGQRCDLWSHGINLRVSGHIKYQLLIQRLVLFFYPMAAQKPLWQRVFRHFLENVSRYNHHSDHVNRRGRQNRFPRLFFLPHLG